MELTIRLLLYRRVCRNDTTQRYWTIHETKAEFITRLSSDAGWDEELGDLSESPELPHTCGFSMPSGKAMLHAEIASNKLWNKVRQTPQCRVPQKGFSTIISQQIIGISVHWAHLRRPTVAGLLRQIVSRGFWRTRGALSTRILRFPARSTPLQQDGSKAAMGSSWSDRQEGGGASHGQQGRGSWCIYLDYSGRSWPLAHIAYKHERIIERCHLWLTKMSFWRQFIKAMRQQDGSVLPNAHLIGMFKRLCKLLFMKVSFIHSLLCAKQKLCVAQDTLHAHIEMKDLKRTKTWNTRFNLEIFILHDCWHSFFCFGEHPPNTGQRNQRSGACVIVFFNKPNFLLFLHPYFFNLPV